MCLLRAKKFKFSSTKLSTFCTLHIDFVDMRSFDLPYHIDMDKSKNCSASMPSLSEYVINVINLAKYLYLLSFRTTNIHYSPKKKCKLWILFNSNTKIYCWLCYLSHLHSRPQQLSCNFSHLQSDWAKTSSTYKTHFPLKYWVFWILLNLLF